MATVKAFHANIVANKNLPLLSKKCPERRTHSDMQVTSTATLSDCGVVGRGLQGQALHNLDPEINGAQKVLSSQIIQKMQQEMKGQF